MRNTAKKITESVKKLRFITKQKEVLGQAPGKLIFVGNKKQNFIRIRLLGYTENEFIEVELNDINEIEKYREKYQKIWINIDGLHNVSEIQKIGSYFNLHPLLQEDIVHTGQRAKIEVETDHMFFIIKMIKLNHQINQLDAEQFSMYLSKDILLTFQEVVGDVFEPVRKRIREKTGRIRGKNLDYLAYCLLDTIVENYNSVMEYFGYEVEELEDKILLTPTPNVLKEINKYKIELNYFRKSIRPARDAILNINMEKTELIAKDTKPFYDDLSELISRAYEAVDNYKDMLSEQLTVYSINVNNKMNDIMKVLTIFSAVFIPLTFIAGIYGTNFDHLPELHYKNSYFIMWAVMVAIAIIMVGYFKYKKWF